MSNGDWFSAMVRFALIVDGRGAETFIRSVFVFRSVNWEAAKNRAIELGYAREADYRNAEGARVVLKLLDVETLDQLSSEIDGAEVYSEPVTAGTAGLTLRSDSRFRPQDSEPTQTGVS